MIGNSDDETNFPRKLVLTNRQVANLWKAFSNNSSINIKLSKIHGPLLKTGLPLLKNVIQSLAKNDLIPLGLTAAALAADAGIHIKNPRLRNNNTNIKWWNGRYYENS